MAFVALPFSPLHLAPQEKKKGGGGRNYPPRALLPVQSPVADTDYALFRCVWKFDSLGTAQRCELISKEQHALWKKCQESPQRSIECGGCASALQRCLLCLPVEEELFYFFALGKEGEVQDSQL